MFCAKSSVKISSSDQLVIKTELVTFWRLLESKLDACALSCASRGARGQSGAGRGASCCADLCDGLHFPLGKFLFLGR